MNTNETDPIADLFARARGHQPHGEPSDFGFATRLRAALAEPAPGLADWVSRFSWGVSAIATPAVVAAAVFLAFRHATLPDGIGGVLAHWSSYLPLSF